MNRRIRILIQGNKLIEYDQIRLMDFRPYSKTESHPNTQIRNPGEYKMHILEI